MFCGALAAAVVAWAQQDGAGAQFPIKPVRWIVPFPPGGAADIVSRALGQKLSEAWGQQVVIDNRAGAGGNLGIELASRSPPDGYTVVLVPATFTTYPSLTRRPVYDPLQDFAPISLVTTSPLVLAVNPVVPAKTVQELVALAKRRPRELNYASSGVGASAHLAAELFKAQTGIQMVHVPYKGQPPAIIDLISGQVQVMFPNMPSVLSFVKSGKLRAVAVSSEQRSTLFPQLPTIAESGLPGFEVTQWGGLVTPAGTSAAVVEKIHRDIASVLRMQDVRNNFATQGVEPVGSTPGAFAAFLRHEMAKWSKLIRAAGITAE
jgi:tripartite-type tricarboxylate transporter receptor subunit TctC